MLRWIALGTKKLYSTFSGHPPEIVKKMPKEYLAEEMNSLLFLAFFFSNQH
ncbi:hypothetical protein YC2023_099597 [Brassica napus]